MDHKDSSNDRLAAVPLFSGLSKDDLELISRLATELQLPAGTELTHEGASGHEFIVVLDGDVEVRRGKKLIAKLGPGSYFGEIALLDNRPRTATVLAITPVTIEVIGAREFRGLIEEVPELAQKLLTTMAQRLGEIIAVVQGDIVD